MLKAGHKHISINRILMLEASDMCKTFYPAQNLPKLKL